MTDDSDETLMAQVTTGNRAAFELLLERHIDALYAYALRLSRSASTAEDLVQDTWLTVWEKSRSYKPKKSKVSTWLHRVLHNKFIDALRKDKYLSYEVGEPVIEKSDAAPESSLVNGQAREIFHHHLNLLPENQRAAIMLVYSQGFSNKEAAHILGLGTRACESLLARARKTLKRGLVETGTDE